MNYKNSSNDEMSMEDILSSIRKYVSEEDTSDKCDDTVEKSNVNDDVIELDEAYIKKEDKVETTNTFEEPKQTYSEKSTLSAGVANEPRKKASPFAQLTNALNSYRENKKEQCKSSNAKTVEQFFSDIAKGVIQDWVDKNMEKVVEKLVLREIEKIKETI